MEVTFLGTGGGRVATFTQMRQTGGMHWHTDDLNLYVDPGPGSIVHARKNNVPLHGLDGIFVSHGHLDHVNDVNVVIEAMTNGCRQEQGILFASKSVVDGAEDTRGSRLEPVLNAYHADAVETVHVITDGDAYEVGEHSLEIVGLEHTDPTCCGFTLQNQETKKTYGYVADTGPFNKLAERYKGCDGLVVNVLRRHTDPYPHHLTTEDALNLVEEVNPELAVLQHFGGTILQNGEEEKQYAYETHQANMTDAELVFAEDNQTIHLAHPEDGVQTRLGKEDSPG